MSKTKLKHYDVLTSIEGEDVILLRYLRGKSDGPDSDEHRKTVRKLARKLVPRTLTIRIRPKFYKESK